MSEITVCEYIWLDGRGGLRSKTRVLTTGIVKNVGDLPVWNYDGSSTWQANSDGNTEVLLTPVFMCADPLRPDMNGLLVLCETSEGSDSCFATKETSEETSKGSDSCEANKDEPLPTNYRNCWNTFTCTSDRNVQSDLDTVQCMFHEPWFGIEQEYTIFFTGKNQSQITNTGGQHYCGTSIDIRERSIVEEHLLACLDAGLTVSGINAEVATRQWEFQIGPVCGVAAADQTYVARFLLERIAEKYDAWINYHPKLVPDANGQGCHINFSTKQMREEGGIDVIMASMEKLRGKHTEHISIYGENNHLRLTGQHETSSIDVFSYGKGTRNTSIRIPNQTVKDGRGYFEDRRPAANVELYGATWKIYETCCLASTDL
jgi:glutamine synthetase